MRFSVGGGPEAEMVAMAKQDKKSKSGISGIVLVVQFLIALFRTSLISLFISLWHRKRRKEPIKMHKKIAAQVAEKKLHEIVSSGRERIMKLLEEGEHGFITKEGKEYLQVFSEDREIKFTYFTKDGRETKSWNPDDYKHQYTVEAYYDEEAEEDAKKKLIRILVSVDVVEGLGHAVCRGEYLNADDFSIYEWTL